jgi:hypothetical protein
MSGFQPPEVQRLPPATSSGLPADLLQAELVYIRRGGAVKPLSPLYDGPYRVLERREKYFRVDIGGLVEAVSADRLKPHLGPSGAVPAVPAKRDRPPGAGQPEGSSLVGGQGRPPEVAGGEPQLRGVVWRLEPQ